MLECASTITTRVRVVLPKRTSKFVGNMCAYILRFNHQKKGGGSTHGRRVSLSPDAITAVAITVLVLTRPYQPSLVTNKCPCLAFFSRYITVHLPVLFFRDSRAEINRATRQTRRYRNCCTESRSARPDTTFPLWMEPTVKRS